MSKRNATGPLRPRKKKGSNYALVDLDPPDNPPNKHPKVEMICVLDLSKSKTSGHVSVTRKTHQHVNTDVLRPSPEEPIHTSEGVGIPADIEPTCKPPTEPAAKPKKTKATKENDSVSSVLTASSKLIIMC